MAQKNTSSSDSVSPSICQRIPIVIVVEGKTEEEYFKAFIEEYKIKATVTNNGTCTSPLQIVQALERRKDKYGGNRTASVALFVAVFDHCTDKDSKTKKDIYEEAIKLCQEKKFIAITSKPSFEFWLLLHFTNIDREMSSKESEEQLKRFYPEYEKGSSKTFYDTKKYIRQAIEYAEKTWKKERERTCAKEDWRKEEKGSYTNVHELIKKRLG